MKQLDISSVFEFMIEKIETGLCAIDENGRVVVYNKKMRELTGESLEEITQRFLSQSLDFNLEQNMLQKVLASGKSFKHVKQTFWNARGEEVRDGAIHHIVRAGACLRRGDVEWRHGRRAYEHEQVEHEKA